MKEKQTEKNRVAEETEKVKKTATKVQKVDKKAPKASKKAPKEKKPTNKLEDKTKTTKILQHVFGDAQKKTIKRLEHRVADINKLEDKYSELSDEDLQKQTDILRKKLAKIEKAEHKVALSKTKQKKVSAKDEGARACRRVRFLILHPLHV